MNFKKAKIHVIFNTFAFVFMIVLNYLAVALPLNNKTTGELSDKYINCFVPAGFTFAIWGVIYSLLAIFILYQLNAIRLRDESLISSFVNIGPRFFISCVANAMWIIAWHYEWIILSFMIMMVLLYQLFKIYQIVHRFSPATWKHRIFVSLPFSVYLGWITVASLANLTVLFMTMKLQSNGPGWAQILIVIAVLIGLVSIFKKQDIGFALVIIWALFGIYSKQAGELSLPCAGVADFAKYGMTFLIIYSLLTLIGKRSKTSNSQV